MSYLYEELPRSARAPLQAHLRGCAQCRDQVNQWQTTRDRLTNWKITTESPQPAVAFAQPLLKWGLAAALVLGLGFGFGRLSASSPDPVAIRLAVEQSLRPALVAQIRQQLEDDLHADLRAAVLGPAQALNSQFRRDLRAGLDEWRARAVASASTETHKLLLDFNEEYRVARQQDHRAILTLFDRADQQRRAEFLSLRRAVETVAVVADNKFQRTETELGQLASIAGTRFLPGLLDESSESLTPETSKGHQ